MASGPELYPGMQNHCIVNGSGEIDSEKEERIVLAGFRLLLVPNRLAKKNALFTKENKIKYLNFIPSLEKG